MIILKTNCNDCIHEGVCKFKGNAKNEMNKFKNMNYLDELQSRNVKVEFSCPDFEKKGKLPLKEIM